MKSFSYDDNYGNTIKIDQLSILPEELDTSFFKNNLTGLMVSKKVLDNNERFAFFISNVTRIAKHRKYKIKVLVISKTELFDGFIETAHYKSFLMTIKSNSRIDKLEPFEE